MATSHRDGKSIRNYSSWLFMALPGMKSLNLIEVLPKAGPVRAPEWSEALTPAGGIVTHGASRQISQPRQPWPDLQLLRYLDTEDERRDAPRRFRRTAASKR
jgi:hypothetical protein